MISIFDIGWQLLYLVTAVVAGTISYQFYKSKNGLLRKIFIVFFAVLSWGLFSVSVSGILNSFCPNSIANTIVRYVSIVPIFFASVKLLAYIIAHFRGTP